MTKTVVSMDGHPIAAPGEPDDNVVACLRDLLAQAEAGELAGIAVARLHYDKGVTWGWVGHSTPALCGALRILEADIVAGIRS